MKRCSPVYAKGLRDINSDEIMKYNNLSQFSRVGVVLVEDLRASHARPSDRFSTR